MADKKIRSLAEKGKPALAGSVNGQVFLESVLLLHCSDACSLWPFGKTSGGYGAFYVNRKQKTAHREMCRLAHGEPSNDSLVARHLCGVKACVNPRHLAWGTQKQNLADTLEHGTRMRGVKCHSAKLAEADVLWLREHGRNIKKEELAKMFGVSESSIFHAISGKTWGWLR